MQLFGDFNHPILKKILTVNPLVLNLFITFAASSSASYYTASTFIEQIPIVFICEKSC